MQHISSDILRSWIWLALMVIFPITITPIPMPFSQASQSELWPPFSSFSSLTSSSPLSQSKDLIKMQNYIAGRITSGSSESSEYSCRCYRRNWMWAVPIIQVYNNLEFFFRVGLDCCTVVWEDVAWWNILCSSELIDLMYKITGFLCLSYLLWYQ